MKLTDGQAQALNMVGELLKAEGSAQAAVAGYAGTGKALAADQDVQSPDGPRPIGTLRVGDLVVGADGTFTEVVGVFPQGVRQAYRVTFRDGATVECDEEHLWSVWTHKRRQRRGQLVTLSLKEIVAAGLRFKSGPHKFSIPLCEPVQFQARTLPIHPYLLGLLIGDGTSLGKTPTLCVPDSESELVETTRALLPHGMEIKVNYAPSCPQWRLIDPGQRGNRLAAAFRSLGLGGLKSPERFIPIEYLLGSQEQRLAVLRGLMDADGSCNSGNRTSFSTHSRRLAADVVRLVQSLGGVAISRLDSRGAWTVNVKVRVVPFSLRRKVANWRFSKKNPPSRHIVSVVPTRMCEHVCIKVAAGDGLFLSKDFIVTHNTTLLGVVAEAHGKPLVLAPTGKAALRVSEATSLGASTIHKWLYAPKENPDTGDVIFTKKSLDQIQIPGNRLVVVDEASMVGGRVWADILSVAMPLGLKVLVIGDPFQLPPVNKGSDGAWTTASALDSVKERRTILTEITRQALDSPIIRASMMIRQGGVSAVEAVTEHMHVLPPQDLVAHFLGLDSGSRALIVHANKTRQRLNEEVRRALGYPDHVLVDGEPILVMQNSNRAEVFNGEVRIFGGWDIEPGEPEVVRDRYKNTSLHMSFGLGLLDGQRVCLSPEEIFAQDLVVGNTAINKVARHHGFAAWDMDYRNFPGHVHANLGHCLTAHKSQGSEWRDVVVYAEDSVGNWNLYGYEGRRWLYTSITRARKNLFICRD